VIQLDTSVLIDALSGAKRSATLLRRAIEDGERIAVSTIGMSG
jgi:predicted nucleic acid-binding protein